jgi:hypothetical protein
MGTSGRVPERRVIEEADRIALDLVDRLAESADAPEMIEAVRSHLALSDDAAVGEELLIRAAGWWVTELEEFVEAPDRALIARVRGECRRDHSPAQLLRALADRIDQAGRELQKEILYASAWAWLMELRPAVMAGERPTE